MRFFVIVLSIALAGCATKRPPGSYQAPAVKVVQKAELQRR